MKRSAILLALVFSASLSFAQEAPNPFTAKNSGPRTNVVVRVMTEFTGSLAAAMAPVQRVLNQSLASLTRAFEGSRSLGGLLLIVALSLAYGIFHAAGPGHGKTIVSSFLLANEGKIRHSVILGYLVAAVHAVSALAIVLVVYYLIRGFFATGIEQANHYIQLATFAVITLIGATMLVRRAMGKGHHHELHGPSEHDHSTLQRDGTAARLSIRNMFGIAVPAGVIPCPGAVAVVLFALSFHMLAISVLAVSSISLGMGTTIGATGALVLLLKRGAVRAVAGNHEERDGKVRKVIEIIGAAILFLFGLVFFLAQL